MEQAELEKIFQESFKEYADAIFRFCLLKVSNVELAEDFTQEVFMRYWQSLRNGKEMTNTRSFLYTIANNLAKDWYKKKKADSLDNKMEQGFEVKDNNEIDAEGSSEYLLVLAHIKEMESGDAEVLLLKYVEGLEPKDIAEIIGETANVVSVRLNRAMTKLQHNLHI